MGILLSARIKICIFEPFPTSSKVGVDQKIFIKYELLWRLKIVYFTSFKDPFKPGKWKKSSKIKHFEVVNSAIRALFTICQCKKISRWALEWFSSQKFQFELFPKTNAFSITFGPRYIHWQSLKETHLGALFVPGSSAPKREEFVGFSHTVQLLVCPRWDCLGPTHQGFYLYHKIPKGFH